MLAILINAFILATCFHYISSLFNHEYYYGGYTYNFLNNYGIALLYTAISVIVYMFFHLKGKEWAIIGGISSLFSNIALSLSTFGINVSLFNFLLIASIFFVGWLAAYTTKKLLLKRIPETNNK